MTAHGQAVAAVANGATAVESRVLDLGRGRPLVEVLEAGEGAPLVYLHGAGGVPVWEGVLPLLAEDYRVYAPLLPGFGRSSGLEALEDQLDLFLHGFDVLDALGLDRPYVVGESMGGWLAAEMAALRPDDIGRLALLAPIGLWRDAMPVVDMFGHTTHELVPYLFHDATSPPALRLAALTDLLSDRDDRTAAQVDSLIELARGLRTAAKFLFPIPENGLERRLPRIAAPTLIVWGRGDRFISPEYAPLFAERIPRAEVRFVDDAGHLVGLERPDACADLVLRWGRGVR